MKSFIQSMCENRKLWDAEVRWSKSGKQIGSKKSFVQKLIVQKLCYLFLLVNIILLKIGKEHFIITLIFY